MDHFPLLFGRKGGASSNLLQYLATPKTNLALDRILEQSAALVKEKEHMNTSIHKAIGKTVNEKQVHVLLNYKRDVFNDRNLEKYLSKIDNATLIEELQSFIKKRKAYQQQLEIIAKICRTERMAVIANLKEITEQHFFKNGMFFSSEVLYKQIAKSDFQFNSLNKKNKKLVTSVLKYLTRSITKTTPYSSFNNIFCLALNDGVYKNETKENYSSFQLINLIYHYLQEVLMHNKDFKNTLAVTLNTTVVTQGTQYNYFINTKNNETFKNIGSNPILSFLQEYLTKNQTISYRALIAKLEALTEETKENIETYVEGLLREGFVMLNFPVSVYHPNWVEHLIKTIEPMLFADTLFKTTLLGVLKDSLEAKEKLEKTNHIEERQEITKDLYQKLISFFTVFGQEAAFLEKVKLKDVFYEDTLSNTPITIKEQDLRKLEIPLQEIYCFFSSVLPQKKSLKFFLAEYMGKHKEISILDFYTDIFLKQSSNFSFDAEILKELNTLLVRLISEILAKKEQEIDIATLYDFKRVATMEKGAFGVYLQTAQEDLKKIVINNFSNGKGANISRFLNAYPPAYTDKVKGYIKHKYTDTPEVKDASLHNANTFYPVSDAVISVAHNGALKKDYDCLLSLRDILVVKNQENGLVLTNTNGKEIEPQVFSLEGMNRRSKFTQFLDIFNKTDPSGFSFFINEIIKYGKNSTENVTVIPRITYQKNTVILRKTWFVKRNFLQSLLHKATLEEKYVAINIWVRENKMPQQVFVKISERDMANPNNDNYKPQYIDFSNSLFMLLFLNMLDKAEDTIEFTEVYPLLSKSDQEQYAQEFILNVG